MIRQHLKAIIGQIGFIFISLLVISRCSTNDRNEKGADFLDFTTVNPQTIEIGTLPMKLLDGLDNKPFNLENIIIIRKLDQRYFFLTMQGEVFFYHSDSSRLSSIADKGRGPGEIISPSDIGISGNGNYVTVVDAGNRKLLTYNNNGNLINETTVDHWIKNGALVDEEKGIYIGIMNGSKQRTQGKSFQVILVNEDGNLLKGFNPFFEPYQAGMGNGINLHRIGQNKFGYYSMFSNQIYSIDASSMETHYSFQLSKPLLPDSLIFAHVRGEIPLDEYIYFLSYFESEDMLVLIYQLDRQKFWSVLDKSTGNLKTYLITYVEDCGNCNKLNVLGISKTNLFLLVSSQMLERLFTKSQTDKIKQRYKDFEYMNFLIEIELL